MALDEYRRKRTFTSTPEPAGDDAVVSTRRRAPGGYFCVQKHLATQLHYDLRIEHQGVLLSWAVPKGPSLDPATKRLAMQTEDHPIEYGDFEGVIPQGYGAGVVMLWDYGTWTPETDDIDAALAKGDLKMTLDGFKLKGSWVLVRTRGWGTGAKAAKDDGRSWLLIKHKDEWSGAVDITSFAPLSVKSGGGFRKVLAQDAPDVWLSNPGATGDASLETLAAILAKLDDVEPVAPGGAVAGESAASAPARSIRRAAKKR